MDSAREVIKKSALGGRQGDFLEASTGGFDKLTTSGGIFEVSAEPFGSLPALFYEGERYSFHELDGIVERIMTNPALRDTGEFRCCWVDKRDD